MRIPNPNPGPHNIVSYLYWPEAQCLEIEFQGGKVYRYFRVEAWRAEEFAKSNSLGRYHSMHIRTNRAYPFMPLAPGQDQQEPKLSDLEAWVRKGEEELKDQKIFERERAADRAGVSVTEVRTRRMRLL